MQRNNTVMYLSPFIFIVAYWALYDKMLSVLSFIGISGLTEPVIAFGFIIFIITILTKKFKYILPLYYYWSCFMFFINIDEKNILGEISFWAVQLVLLIFVIKTKVKK